MLAGGLASRPGHTKGTRLGWQKAAHITPQCPVHARPRQGQELAQGVRLVQLEVKGSVSSLLNCNAIPESQLLSKQGKQNPAELCFTFSFWAHHVEGQLSKPFTDMQETPC